MMISGRLLPRWGRNTFRGRNTPRRQIWSAISSGCATTKRRIGALIVLEGKVQLGDMMKGGVVLDARISRELLLTIFFPNTALHDGAVIIRKGRIAAAGCILPLAQMDRQNFGTRHRAALGATEVSDATVIVVSEERGEVSVASKGHLAVMPDAEQLKETLNNVIEH